MSGKEIKAVTAEFRMKSGELAGMLDAERTGNLREICWRLSAVDGGSEFATFMALNEHILRKKALQMAKRREDFAQALPEVESAKDRAAADREALMQEYAARNEDGSVVEVMGAEGQAAIVIADDARAAEFATKEAEIVEGCWQAVAVLTEPSSRHRLPALQDFDDAPIRLKLYRIPWRDVPASVGGGMLLAALPLLVGVPKGIVKAAEKLRDEEAARVTDTAESVLSWQGVRESHPGDGAVELPEEPEDPVAGAATGTEPGEGREGGPVLPPFMMGACRESTQPTT